MPAAVGNISIFMEPHTLGAPDDLEKAIVSFINQAEKRLDVAVQELGSLPVASGKSLAKEYGREFRRDLERHLRDGSPAFRHHRV